MKKHFLLGFILVLSVFLFGCSANDDGKTKTGEETHQQTVLPPNPSDSNAGAKTASPDQLVLTEGDPVGVSGENACFSLRSVDFIDENTGWVVRDEYNSNQQGSQILRTQDGGAHWEKTKLNNVAVERLIFVNKTTGWAIGQAERETTSGDQPCAMKILHTQDGGKSWDVQWEDQVDLPSGYDLWFQDTTRGYALISGTMFSTGDGGKQWSPVLFGVDDFTPQHMSFVNADTGWVIGRIELKNRTESSPGQNPEIKLVVLQTIDAGKHWRQQFERNYSAGPVGSIDIDFVNATTGWFLTSDVATMTGDLYYTSDGGREWKKINKVKSARPTPGEIDFVTREIGWIPLDVGAGPISGGLMLTRDGGKNFDLVESRGETSSAREVDFISEQQGWAVGNTPNQGDYLIRTTDGGQTWTQVYPGIRPAKDISFVDNEHGFGLGQLSDSGALLYTADGGDTWQNMHSFSKNYYPGMLLFVNRDIGWVLASSIGSNKTVILKTTDGGNTWTPLDGDIPQVEVFFTSYFRFFDPDNGIMVATDVDNIVFYRTQDGGRTWQASRQKRLKGSYQFSFVSQKEGWEIISTGSRQYTVDLNQTENGSTWQSLGRIGPVTWPCGIEFISRDKGWMLVEEAKETKEAKEAKEGYLLPDRQMKLLVTADGGETWSAHRFPSGFQLQEIRGRMPVRFTDDEHGWVLATGGLLRTRDGGKTWTWQ